MDRPPTALSCCSTAGHPSRNWVTFYVGAGCVFKILADSYAVEAAFVSPSEGYPDYGRLHDLQYSMRLSSFPDVFSLELWDLLKG